MLSTFVKKTKFVFYKQKLEMKNMKKRNFFFLSKMNYNSLKLNQIILFLFMPAMVRFYVFIKTRLIFQRKLPKNINRTIGCVPRLPKVGRSLWCVFYDFVCAHYLADFEKYPLFQFFSKNITMLIGLRNLKNFTFCIFHYKLASSRVEY